MEGRDDKVHKPHPSVVMHADGKECRRSQYYLPYIDEMHCS